MGHIHFRYKKDERPRFDKNGKKVMQVSLGQYAFHWLYSVFEPPLLRMADRILKGIATETDPKKRAQKVKQLKLMNKGPLSSGLPKAVAVSQNAAFNMIDYVLEVEGPRGARLAVGPCPCQYSLNDFHEPIKKDITLFYAADIFRGLDRGYELITGEQAKKILDDCQKIGLVHNLLYLCGSGKGVFAICNCDTQTCPCVRGKILADTGVEPGTEICKEDPEKCVGVENCGACIKRCPFGYNSMGPDGKAVLNREKCVGCELCVTTCKSGARTLEERANYKYENIMPKQLFLKNIYPEYAEKGSNI